MNLNALSEIISGQFGRTVFGFDTIDSTNTFAKTLPKENAPHGTLIISEEQTVGRGRLNRQWIAEKGKNLLFTIILYPVSMNNKINLLPFAGALAVADAIEHTTQLQCSCKWPNDIVLRRKKVCGMLLEKTGEKVILGVGINVNQESFPKDILYKTTSLYLESGQEIDRVSLLKQILIELEKRYEQLSRSVPKKIIEDWKKKSLHFGEKITVLESKISYTATAIDVSDDGSLIIHTEDGMKKQLYSGDVSLVYS